MAAGAVDLRGQHKRLDTSFGCTNTSNTVEDDDLCTCHCFVASFSKLRVQASFAGQIPDYGKLEETINQVLLEFGCQRVQHSVAKCISIFETKITRHGNMLVGGTLGSTAPPA